ncbi:MAG: WbqC family protein [Bacteroidales bacterium]|nr:WbqC family protein [Bacteroidales bacterium]
MTALLSTAFFPNVQYMSKFLAGNVVIEKYETYPKQTYRNRCNILSANGVLPLSVPVQKNYHTLTKDIRIDYSEMWQRNHLTALKSAYKNSAFYDYYFYKFERFFEKKENFLIDLNENVLQALFSVLKIDADYSYTADYIFDSADYADFRESISPKPSKNRLDETFAAKPYTQVFCDRFEFVPNLSILDLIFNVGPESREYLANCIV